MQTRAVLLAALASASIGVPGPAAADIKIGFSGPLSGPAAVVGQDQIDGFMLAVDMLGGKLGGQPVTVIREDDQLKPEIGQQIIRKFIDKDKVDAIVGLGFSNVVMASLRRIVEAGTPAIATNAGPSPVAGLQCAPNVFSVAWQNDGAAEAMGKLVQEKGVRRVYLMAPNYQAGKDMVVGFKRFFKGEVADEVYTQVNQTDYSAEISQLQNAKADALFAFYPGGMGVNFVRQLSQAGMLEKLPMYSVFTIDGTTMPALRDAAAGAVTGAMWDAALGNAENKKFVAAFEAKYKRTPSEYAATGFDAAHLLAAAVHRLKGDTSDKKAFAAAIKTAGQEFRSVRGPFRFNNNNLPIQNYYAFQVVKEGGQVAVKQIATPLTDHKDAYHDKCALR
jgi:branched-chain amino acid transport system substrate-binding protein